MPSGGKRPGAGRPRKVPVEVRVEGDSEPEINDPKFVEDYLALGAPPEDPLDAISWFAKALTVSAHHLFQESISEKVRRTELRQIAKTVSALTPLERLRAAENKVRRAAEDMGRSNADPEVTPLPPGSKPLRM